MRNEPQSYPIVEQARRRPETLIISKDVVWDWQETWTPGTESFSTGERVPSPVGRLKKQVLNHGIKRIPPV